MLGGGQVGERPSQGKRDSRQGVRVGGVERSKKHKDGSR